MPVLHGTGESKKRHFANDVLFEWPLSNFILTSISLLSNFCNTVVVAKYFNRFYCEAIIKMAHIFLSIDKK